MASKIGLQDIGKRFGRLVVLDIYAIQRENNSRKRTYYVCECDCGNIKAICKSDIKQGYTRSCGCLEQENREKMGSRNHIDLIGYRFGKLVVVLEAGVDQHGVCLWDCICDCDTPVRVPTGNLTSGHTKSCGCSKGEFIGNALRKWTPDEKRTRHQWETIPKRCLDPNHKSYKDYGGRGIQICERWLIFENFLADMGVCPKGYSIERIDNEGHYCLENCVWIPRNQQGKNKRTSKRLELNGVIKIKADWSKELGVSNKFIDTRLKKNIPFATIVQEARAYMGLMNAEVQTYFYIAKETSKCLNAVQHLFP